MLKKITHIFLFTSFFLASLFPNTNNRFSQYFPLRQSSFYLIAEYELLDSDAPIDVFIMNQPFTYQSLKEIISSDNRWEKVLSHKNRYLLDGEEDEHLGIVSRSGIKSYSNTYNSSMHPFTLTGGYISIPPFSVVNEFVLDKSLQYDNSFHGDTGEWLAGYFHESYGIVGLSSVELFGGRVSRNFGVLNDYGLILSNNPYAFDHYGFSATGQKYKYSFYTTRLNDIEAEDIQGDIIPIGDIQNSKRYWAVQRFDVKLGPNAQLGLTEATVYGGPEQNVVAAYMNPVQFFYAAQRNHGIQLNSFWQVNIFIKPFENTGIFVDLLADDIIVNNEPGVDDRAVHPDRLGLLVKMSRALQKNQSLVSVRYARIWNETYTSYRTFENYTYFKKGLGFPMSSYEGLKFTYTALKYYPLFVESDLEFWRHGDRNLVAPFHDEINSFPVGPVEHGISTHLYISKFWAKGVEVELDYRIDFSAGSYSELFSSASSSYELSISAVYYLQKQF
jgi:hypothetical protein